MITLQGDEEEEEEGEEEEEEEGEEEEPMDEGAVNGVEEQLLRAGDTAQTGGDGFNFLVSTESGQKRLCSCS